MQGTMKRSKRGIAQRTLRDSSKREYLYPMEGIWFICDRLSRVDHNVLPHVHHTHTIGSPVLCVPVQVGQGLREIDFIAKWNRSTGAYPMMRNSLLRGVLRPFPSSFSFIFCLTAFCGCLRSAWVPVSDVYGWLYG